MMRFIILIFLIPLMAPVYSMSSKKVNLSQAIDHAVSRYGLRTEPELIRYFKKANVPYPPKDVAFLAFKKEQHIQLWARESSLTPWHYIRTYPLTAFSGRLGPKLKEHDLQIPEGLYHITMLNPFSAWHLSMMLDYPNQFDKIQAIRDGRSRLGGDIFMHGKSLSAGCLAVGDRAIDQMFLLAHRVGVRHVQVIIAPNDLRKEQPATTNLAQPRWLPELYRNIGKALSQFPVKARKKMQA